MKLVIEIKPADLERAAPILEKMGFKAENESTFFKFVSFSQEDDTTDPRGMMLPYLEALADHKIRPFRTRTEIQTLQTVSAALQEAVDLLTGK